MNFLTTFEKNKVNSFKFSMMHCGKGNINYKFHNFPLWISKCQYKNICPFSLCDQVNPSANHETFFNVANSFFADGVYNWGRVGCLFYFAYKMAVKVLRCLSRIHLFNISICWEFFYNFLRKKCNYLHTTLSKTLSWPNQFILICMNMKTGMHISWIF